MRPQIFSPVSVLLFALSGVTLATSATAMDAKHYTALRSRLHCDRSLTYTEVSQKLQAYGGTVMELRGTVGGTVGSDDGLSIVLNLTDSKANSNQNAGSVTLDIPKSEVETVRLYSSASLRVLVKIAAVPYSNVPLMTVQAVALETDIRPIEKQEEANERAREETRRARSRASARNFLDRSRGSSSSRSATPRGTYSAPISGDLKSLEEAFATLLNAETRPMFGRYAQFISDHNKRLGLPRAAEIAANLLHYSWRSQVDPRLVVAMIVAESDFDPNSTSRTGAAGLGQLMPGTAQSLGISNPYDIGQNLDGSIAYLRSRLDTFASKANPDGSLSLEQIRLAMAAYNAGVGAVKKYGGIPPYRETQAYVKRIEKLYLELCS